MPGNRCLIVLLALVGCAAPPQQQRSVARPQPAVNDQQLVAEVAELKAELGRIQAELAASREGAAAIELRRIDAETRLARLQKRYEELERTHGEAVSEVVRAQAKLRGSVGQADAASDIAEAELAINSAGLESDEQDQARSMLAQASQEFDQGNYGGALYLSNQVKRLIAESRARNNSLADYELVADEVPFESPLALMVSENTNVRDGPGLGNSVIRTLKQGTPVDGHSQSGAWVRVRMADGSNGWVYQTLVVARDKMSEDG